MIAYEHTQSVRVWILLVLAVDVVVFALAASGSVAIALLWVPIAAASLVMIRAFSNLTVTVTDAELLVNFGGSWPRRRVRLVDVKEVERARSAWWRGFGIRRISRGWLWNVWGLDAVELKLISGKRLWVGTDEPDVLLSVLAGRIGLQ